jgi:hypothetical protein
MGKTDVISGRGEMLIVPRGFQPTMISIFICSTSAFLMRSFCHQVPKFWCDKDVNNILKFFYIARLFKMEKFFFVSLKLKHFCWFELFFGATFILCLLFENLLFGYWLNFRIYPKDWELILKINNIFILFYSENVINKENQLTIIL